MSSVTNMPPLDKRCQESLKFVDFKSSEGSGVKPIIVALAAFIMTFPALAQNSQNQKRKPRVLLSVSADKSYKNDLWSCIRKRIDEAGPFDVVSNVAEDVLHELLVVAVESKSGFSASVVTTLPIGSGDGHVSIWDHQVMVAGTISGLCGMIFSEFDAGPAEKFRSAARHTKEHPKPNPFDKFDK